MRCDAIWRNANLATMANGGLGEVRRGIVACRKGRIAYVGAPEAAEHLVAVTEIDCEGRLVTPGLIDCHTHLIHAGNRAHEFELRLAGASYEEIARAGGGILSTMSATRAASEDQLVAEALPRVDALISEGVTTVEVKSGYGLETEAEMRMLRAARRLGRERAVTLVTTFLGAHALPPEFAGNPDGYVDYLCGKTLPLVAAAGLADAVDAYCEGIGFTAEQTDRLFAAARALDLPVKLHAEQLSNQHGAALAAKHGALSADHLEYLDKDGVAAMARADTLSPPPPRAFYFTRETKLPPVAALRGAGVPIAIATDCNPGTSPLTSLLLAMNMAATLFRLTVDECLAGVTINAARALGLARETGSLGPGKAGDVAIWNVERPAGLVYRLGFN